MTLRPMTMDDADFMLELKNDPITREFAILTHDEIQRDAHIAWLEKHLHEFQVIQEFRDRNIGAVRVQDVTIPTPPGYAKTYSGSDLEVSIWIASKYRGCGWGSDALRSVRKMRMSAKIVIGNVPSMRAFIKAGFHPEKLVDNTYYIFRYYDKSKIYAP